MLFARGGLEHGTSISVSRMTQDVAIGHSVHRGGVLIALAQESIVVSSNSPTTNAAAIAANVGQVWARRASSGLTHRSVRGVFPSSSGLLRGSSLHLLAFFGGLPFIFWPSSGGLPFIFWPSSGGVFPSSSTSASHSPASQSSSPSSPSMGGRAGPLVSRHAIRLAVSPLPPHATGTTRRRRCKHRGSRLVGRIAPLHTPHSRFGPGAFRPTRRCSD